ncbi:hypothetical protein TNCV_3780871 [Trichonephila clavipes]|nr:hypothetical protein TNCV_3780871 [Trichonephila clavipes]
MEKAGKSKTLAECNKGGSVPVNWQKDFLRVHPGYNIAASGGGSKLDTFNVLSGKSPAGCGLAIERC